MLQTKDTLPWRIHSSGPTPEGALSYFQKIVLASKHEIPAQLIDELSKKIEASLTPTIPFSQPELGQAKREKGGREVRKALKAIQNASLKLAAAQKILEELRFKNPISVPGMKNPGKLRVTEFNAAAKTIAEFGQFLETMSRNDLAYFTSQPDNRRIRDERRLRICNALFNCWLDAEKKLSITTDPITSERTGPLVDFVNSVVACVTEPSSMLNGEAIRSELDDFKAPFVPAHRTE